MTAMLRFFDGDLKNVLSVTDSAHEPTFVARSTGVRSETENRTQGTLPTMPATS